MAKTLAFLVGASAIALVGMATVPQPASAGSHVGVEVGPGSLHRSTPSSLLIMTMTIGVGVVTIIAVRIGTVITVGTITGISASS